MRERIEIGEYTTATGQVLKIYATFRKGGLNAYRTPVEPGYGFNLDIDGRGKLWFWLDWAQFAAEVNKIAGEDVLDPGQNPLVDEEEVPEEWWCPNCSESRIDMLVIQDDEVHVHCLRCGEVYTLTW